VPKAAPLARVNGPTTPVNTMCDVRSTAPIAAASIPAERSTYGTICRRPACCIPSKTP
jgi:hypothetical protein